MNGSGEFGILDKQIDVLRTGGILPEKDILSLCKKVRAWPKMPHHCLALLACNACSGDRGDATGSAEAYEQDGPRVVWDLLFPLARE